MEEKHMRLKKIKEPKLYQELTPKQLNKFILDINGMLNGGLETLKTVQLKEPDLYGEFIIIDGWYFKSFYGGTSFQCLQTPTEKSEKKKVNIIKAKTDSLNYHGK